MIRKVTSIIVALTMAASLMLLGGCGSKDEAAQGTVQSTQSTEKTASAEAAPDPFGKYDEPVTITAVLGYSPAESKNGVTAPEGTTPENQSFVKLLDEKLNIKLKYIWTVAEDQYQQKVNLMMASGEYPDIMCVPTDTFENLITADKVADLTDAYEKYGSPLLKQGLNTDGGNALNASKRDGKLLALPWAADPAQQIPLLWIRNDWLKNVNMTEPKNMDDVIKIADAFTFNDPDKNEKADTVGFPVIKDLFFSMGDTKGFFNGYNAYPDRWIKGNNGKLIPGWIQPEMKAPLLKLQEMYKKGIIDKEFAIKDLTKLAESMTAGKVGMFYGEWWLPGWPLQDGVNKDPKADWKCYTLPSADGNGAKAVVKSAFVNRYNVVNKDCKNPEAMIKILNLYTDLTEGTDLDKKYGDAYKLEKGFVYTWVPVRTMNIAVIESNFQAINKAIETNDESSLTSEETKTQYADAKAYTAGDRSKWGTYYSRVAKDGGWGTTSKMVKEGRTILDEYIGAPTPTMLERDETLKKMTSETFTKIIMGGSINEFDQYVEKWKKLGGNEIINEVNDWYAKSK